VEALLGPGEFIATDTFMNCEESQISLITGPNMAGKSTYLRQVALIVLMAQAGCPVPAQSARIGVVDRIFTRVGASDDLSTGKSTFMVEMNETAGILNSASNRSLIVLDEIGRGTSTFDGISIAWAVVEYLSFQTEVKARTLFATHYHELTSLESRLPGVKNFNIAVKEWNENILFLRKILPGPADKSYGIHVARLAGLPLDVINRAKEVLMKLEAGGLHALSQEENSDDSPPREFQLDLFQKDSNKYESHRQLVTRLQEVDALNLTPLEAIQVLHQLVGEARQMNGDI